MSSESRRSHRRRPLETAGTRQAETARKPSRLQSLWQAHPRLVTWFLLAIGMVAILLYAARDAELLPGQRFVLVLATVALAGLCTWIIGWEQQAG